MSDAILVTGASGLVGSEVVARLRARGIPVVALTHRRPEIVDSRGTRIEAVAFGAGGPVEFLRGDVREAGFGLAPEMKAAVAQRIRMVVHCAATTDFDAPERDYDELNVNGTVHTADLARSWDVPLVYVSTAYVCGRAEGTIAESDLSDAAGFGNGYERSKYRAEQHIRQVGGLRWAIVRPGIVTGCTGTGAMRDYKNLYTVVKLIVEGKLRTLPGRYDATLALAPVDHVAEVIRTAVTDFGRAEGRTHHAVGAQTLSLRQISDVFAEYPSFRVARFVPKAGFDPDALDILEREYYLRIGAQYTHYFNGKRHFDTTTADELLGTPSPRTDTEYLRVLLDYCLESGYLGTPLPGIEEALECIR